MGAVRWLVLEYGPMTCSWVRSYDLFLYGPITCSWVWSYGPMTCSLEQIHHGPMNCSWVRSDDLFLGTIQCLVLDYGLMSPLTIGLPFHFFSLQTLLVPMSCSGKCATSVLVGFRRKAGVGLVVGVDTRGRRVYLGAVCRMSIPNRSGVFIYKLKYRPQYWILEFFYLQIFNSKEFTFTFVSSFIKIG